MGHYAWGKAGFGVGGKAGLVIRGKAGLASARVNLPLKPAIAAPIVAAHQTLLNGCTCAEQADGIRSLRQSDDTGQNPKYSRPFTIHSLFHTGHFRVQITVINRRLGFIRVIPQCQHAFKTVNCAHNPRQTQGGTSIVQHISGGDAVAAIDHEVYAMQQFVGISGFQEVVAGFGLHIRILPLQFFRRCLGFVTTDIGLSIKGLPVEIAFVDVVAIDNPQIAHTGCGEVLQDRATKSAGADYSHAGRLQPFLAFGTEPGQADLFGEAIHPLTINHRKTAATRPVLLRQEFLYSVGR